MTLYVIVPVLNEYDNMERLFGAFREIAAEYAPVQIILVDDGSTDSTGEHAQRLSAGLDFQLLTHPVNQGPGGAFGTAFEYLAPRLHDDDWVLTLEGDNTSRHEILRQMFQRLDEGFDVILASVYIYGGGITNTDSIRVILSSLANTFVKEFLDIHGIFTVSSFYRLFRAPVIKGLQRCYGPRIIERAGFECMVEMLIKMVYLKTSISEVPMVLDTSRRAGKSKMKLVKTSLAYFGVWLSLKQWREKAGG